MSRILLVDDDASILHFLGELLRQEGHEVIPAHGGDKAIETLQEESFDLLLSDIRMEPVDGLELLRQARSLHPSMIVIMLTGHASVESSVEAMREGAFDYVQKPFKVDELKITIQRALEFHATRMENVKLKEQLEARYGFANMVAESPAMRRVCDMIKRVAPGSQTVMISGESGTGKEVVAKAIHANSSRKNQNFVAINCAAVPAALLESELFGHAKGSFTGATTDKDGLFMEAHDGTIFLDEIGSMPMDLQSKLLRVLQEREVRRVGSNKDVKVDVRVIAASNEDLEEQIAKNLFRQDLYFRLNVIPLHLAPLRERTEDILPLSSHFLLDLAGSEEMMPDIDADAKAALEGYSWPGNVRELENAVRHAFTFCRDETIRREDLPAKVQARARAASPAALLETESVEEYSGKSLKLFLRQKEREYLSAVLAYYEGDKEKAAKALKISLATLYRKLPDPDG